MKKLLLVTLILLFNLSFSQNYKFRKVSKEELAEKSYNNDSTVNAAVLYKERKIHYDYVQDEGFKRFVEVFERVKIYKKEGFNWGTIVENLYDENATREEKLLNLKAYTYNLEGGKIQESKLKKNGIFKEETNKYWKQYKFTMPNLKEGSIIEYKYLIESPIVELDDDVFQHNIPIKKLNYRLEIPEYFRVTKILNTRATYVPEITERSKKRKFLVSYHSAFANGTAKASSKFSKENLVERTYDIIENIYEADLQNIPALKKEAYVDNIGNYRAVAKWEITSMKGFDGSVREFSTDWDQVTRSIYNRERFGKQLSKTNYYEEDIKSKLAGVNSPDEKIAIIYNYVKSKVKWNGLRGYTAELGVKKAYKEGAGNTADINLMLTSMLRYAGLDASPVLVSTRDNGIPIFPSTSGFNYVITGVSLSNGFILLDATNKYASANILQENTINWKGRIIKENGASAWISLTPQTKSKEIALMSVEINDDLSISGKIRKQLTEYLALDYRDDYYAVKNEGIVKNFEDGKGDIEITNLTIKNKEALNKPINYTYDYKLNNEVEEIGDKLYISPLLFLAPKDNPFKQDSRTYPIDFIYPIYSKYSVTVKIPEGYAVESLPENAKIQLNGTDGEFSYIIKSSGNTLQVMVTTELNKTLILPTEYNQFKQFFQLSFEKQLDKIVLKKV
jgi:transglutaminase-like putative cysteine protease